MSIPILFLSFDLFAHKFKIKEVLKAIHIRAGRVHQGDDYALESSLALLKTCM
jgi:hypothetical protein